MAAQASYPPPWWLLALFYLKPYTKKACTIYCEENSGFWVIAMPISVQLAIILLRRAWVCFTILPEREAGMHVKCAMKRRSFSIRVNTIFLQHCYGVCQLNCHFHIYKTVLPKVRAIGSCLLLYCFFRALIELRLSACVYIYHWTNKLVILTMEWLSWLQPIEETEVVGGLL